ncbi:MAG: ROK family protein [Candidatus Paceibacteria bacterium]
MTFVVFDIGGTKTRIGFSADGKKLDTVKSFKTDPKPEQGLAEVVSVIKECGGAVTAIAGGVRGVLREDRLGIDHDGILTKWANVSIVDFLAGEFMVPVFLENDTALAGLGEAIYGAGKGVGLVVYHTVSTGVGGVRIENGVIDMASIGFEPGHQVLDIDRTILGEDVPPTLENLVSGRAVEGRMGVKPYEIAQDDVIWDELAGYLAQGLRNTVLYWSPEAIILGGSMMVGDPRIPLDSVRRATVAVLDGVMPCPFITTAELGDEAGVHGALAFLQQKMRSL